MKLPQRHKEILLKEKEDIEKYGFKPFSGGYEYFNQRYVDIIIENLQVTQFSQIFANIMVFLHDEGLANIPEVENIKQCFENKLNANAFVSNYLRNYLTNDVVRLIYKYCHILFDELLEKNPDIVYIDTYEIISINPLNIIDCPIPYLTKSYPLGIFKAKKIYAFYDGQNIEVRGHRHQKEMKTRIKSKIREIKLDKLGIYE